jgi:hypothetical protein
MHSTYIFDPHAIFARFNVFDSPTARMREAGRVGFLVPARVSYLLFGPLPGFFVFRYVLALIAIVPVYLLLRRCYGRWAGFAGIAVVMSSPIILAAWSTDYPDSAAVSYLIGALAAFALTWEAQRPLAWMLVGATLLTLAVWTHGAAVPLVAVLGVVYLGLRLRLDRAHLVRDVALLVGSAAVVTLSLGLLSKLLIGQLNFISPTLRSASYLSRPEQLAWNHSASWSWAGYDNYLLIPPAVATAYIVVFARRWRDLGTTRLFIGLVGVLQLAVFAYLQFEGSLQTLEMHFFSSLLWSSTSVMLAMIVAEVASSIPWLSRRPGAPRWLLMAVPTILVLGVVLGFEIHATRWTMTWATGGLAVALVLVIGAAFARLVMTLGEGRRSVGARIAFGGLLPAAAIVVMLESALILAVAVAPLHAQPPNTVRNPYPPYATVFGGSETLYAAQYEADAQLAKFVGPPAYPNELLMTWEPRSQYGALQGPLGLYHNAFTRVSQSFPRLNPQSAMRIRTWRPGQVVLISLTGEHFAEAARSLAPFHPVVVRRAAFTHGTYSLHAWLIDLTAFSAKHASAVDPHHRIRAGSSHARRGSQ